MAHKNDTFLIEGLHHSRKPEIQFSVRVESSLPGLYEFAALPAAVNQPFKLYRDFSGKKAKTYYS